MHSNSPGHDSHIPPDTHPTQYVSNVSLEMLSLRMLVGSHDATHMPFSTLDAAASICRHRLCNAGVRKAAALPSSPVRGARDRLAHARFAHRFEPGGKESVPPELGASVAGHRLKPARARLAGKEFCIPAHI